MTTNYEKIKNMTVEEMAETLDAHIVYRCLHCFYHYKNKGKPCDPWTNCKNGYLKWLQSESEK